MKEIVNDFRQEIERLEETEEELNWSMQTLEESKIDLLNQIDCLEKN